MGSGDWAFATGDALTRKAWAKKWWVEAKTESYFYGQGFVGQGSDNIIVEYPDLEKDQGDKVTIGTVRELSGAGVANDGALEGNEEYPAVYDDAITLAQIRNAVRTKGRESDIRPSDNGIRTYAKELLQRWMSMTIDNDIFDSLSASATKNLYGGDATSTTDIEAGDYMTLNLVAKCVAYAKKASPLIIGPTVKGKQTNGVLIVSPDSAYDLSEFDASWAQAQREAQRQGPDNPLFTGALGMYKGVPIHEHSRINLGTTWGGSTLTGSFNLFLGIQAGAIAYAKKKIWEEKTFDYQNKVGFAIGAIYGFTKCVFNSADNAVVVVNTYRTSN